MADDHTSARVTALFGGVVISQVGVCEELVLELKRLLEAAQAGEIVGMVWASQYSDSTTAYNLVGVGSRALVGSLAIAQVQIIEDLAELDPR